ncbi:MAG: extracellular solute-binding protein family 1 [Ilumatobacteraceae bacterium]|nr:extracellular solute-binding protein family 1 [Ilumatobacteraceae bacterium]
MRIRAGLAIGAICAVAITACGSSKATSTSTAGSSGGSATGAASGDGNITLYSGQHEQTVTALVAAFTKATGIKVSVRSDDEATLANQILQEGTDSPADVFFAENPPALNVLDESKILAPVAATTLAKVATTYSPASGDWVGVSARAVALAFNTDQVKEADLPTSILDFAKPAWKGKVGFAPGETDFQPIITTITKLSGADAAKAWLEGIKSNAKVYDDNEGLVAAIDRGEVETGIIDHYYWYRLRDEVGASKLKTGLHYFAAGDAGNLVDVSGAGQLVTSKHPVSDAAFLAFLVSAAGQQIIASSESYEYPLGSGVQTTKDLRPFAQFGTSPMTIADLGDGKPALELLQQVGLL